MSDQFSENKYKIGFFGGSFDPIHQGHVSVALATINKFNLHKVLICPAFFAPLRETRPLFSAEHRLAMAETVCKEHSKLELFDQEVLSGKTCYTYHTLKSVQKNFPKCKIFMMLGDDQFAKFNQWKFNQQILNEFSVIIFNRDHEGDRISTNHMPSPSLIYQLHNQLLPYSSSAIRDCIQKGNDITNLVPSCVFSYMKKNQLLDFTTNE